MTIEAKTTAKAAAKPDNTAIEVRQALVELTLQSKDLFEAHSNGFLQAHEVEDKWIQRLRTAEEYILKG